MFTTNFLTIFKAMCFMLFHKEIKPLFVNELTILLSPSQSIQTGSGYCQCCRTAFTE